MFLLRQPFAYGAQGKDARISYFFQRAGNLEPSSWAHYPFNFYAVPITCFTYGYPLLMTKQIFTAGSIRDQSAFP